MGRLRSLLQGLAFALAIAVAFALESPASTPEYYNWGEYYKSKRPIGGGVCTNVSPTLAPPGCSTSNRGQQCTILIGMTQHYIWENNSCLEPLNRR